MLKTDPRSSCPKDRQRLAAKLQASVHRCDLHFRELSYISWVGKPRYIHVEYQFDDRHLLATHGLKETDEKTR